MIEASKEGHFKIFMYVWENGVDINYV
jgi:hypothetical protein